MAFVRAKRGFIASLDGRTKVVPHGALLEDDHAFVLRYPDKFEGLVQDTPIERGAAAPGEKRTVTAKVKKALKSKAKKDS